MRLPVKFYLQLMFFLSMAYFFVENVSAQNVSCNIDVENFVDNINPEHSSFTDSYPDKPAVWSQANLLRALVEVHRRYQDQGSFDKLQVGVEYLLANTAENRGFEDVLRGNAKLPAWGSKHYSCQKYTISAVHTGILSYSIAYLARTILNNPTKYAVYSDAALEYLIAAESALDIHANEFVETGGNWIYARPNNFNELGMCERLTRKGEIIDPPKIDDYRFSSGAPLPYNMMLLMGLTHLELAQAFELPGPSMNLQKSAYHLDRAIKLGQSFKGALIYVSETDSYQWKYIQDYTDTAGTFKSGRYEDMSHGAADVLYAVELAKLGLVFNDKDLERFVNTFNLATSKRSHVFSHVNKSDDDRGTKSNRWQAGAVRWAALSFYDPSLLERAREIFFLHNGGDRVGSGSSNWYGEALLLGLRDNDFRYPVLAASDDDLISHRPDYALRQRNVASLFRTPSMATSTIIDVNGVSKSASSCAKFDFENPRVGDLTVNYAHTMTTGSIDSCLGEDACGSAPGFHLFFANRDNIGWTFGGSLSHAVADEYVIGTVSPPLSSYQRVMTCRSGAGHARDNIGIRYLGVDTSACPVNNTVFESNFSNSNDGWNKGLIGEAKGYIYSSTQGHLYAGEPSGPVDEELHTTKDPLIGKLDIGYQKLFANVGTGFKVSGWTRSSSDYVGTGKVNNRCVKVLNGEDNKILHSKCMHWINQSDTGWRHFDYDFTPYVQGYENIRVAIGSWDSWRKNWHQEFFIDDVQVELRQ